jgi:hypothetical protein
MKTWKNDHELFSVVQRELFTCVVGDVMDKLDLQHQFLPPQIRPLRPDMVVVGRALPVLAVDVFAERVAGTANQLMAKPFGLMLEALDDLRPNEVYVCTGSPAQRALGRTDEYPGSQAGELRNSVERLHARHQSRPDLNF